MKNQGGCNSCYAFAAVGALEGAYKIKTGKLVEMSAQQLVDCSRGYGNNMGCSGGYMTFAYDYLKSNKIMSWESYPYGAAGSCKYKAA